MKISVVGSVVVVAMLVGVGTGSAQTIGGGVKIGANFATVSGDVDAEKSVRTGLVVGGFVTVPAGGMLAFQPEVLYSMQGVKIDDDGTEATVAIDEVQIPLLLRVGRSAGGTGGYLVVGPSIGFITSAKIKVDDDEQDFKDELKSTDVGLVIGAGVTVNRFLIEGRYTAGLTNLNDDDSSDDNKSRVFSVLVGIGF